MWGLIFTVAIEPTTLICAGLLIYKGLFLKYGGDWECINNTHVVHNKNTHVLWLQVMIAPSQKIPIYD